MQIPFSPPDITELEIQEVAEALRSGWITTGPRTKKLERELEQYVHADRCVCLNSQTACGELSLRLLGIGPGDEVVTSAYTYTATASVVCHVGAKLVLIDTQKDNFEMDYDKLSDAINERTKAVIPVDLCGVPCDYERVFAAVESKRNLFAPSNPLQAAIGRAAVIADSAHAFGAIWHGRMLGSVADFTNFSFHAVKNFTTAEGGALTWHAIDGVDSEELYRRLQFYSLHGQSKDALAKEKLGGWEYDIVGPWYKCNMTDIMAAIGLAQLRRYPALLARRKELIERYDAAIRPLGIQTLDHYTSERCSTGHVYLTRTPGITADQRGEIIGKMAERGIACNVHFKPLPLFTAYQNLDFDIRDYPNAYDFFANEISLPLYSRLTDEEAQFVTDTFVDVIKGYL